MNENQLLDALNALLPAELDTLIFKLGVPTAMLPGAQAPQASRCVELLRWAKQAGRLGEVERRLGELGAGGAGVSGARVSIARLPQTGAALFGREAELTWLDARWSGGAHVVSIVAWGGVGKSALVNGWIRGMLEKGWSGAERVFGWSFYSQGTDRMGSADEFIGAALKWFGDADPTVGSMWEKGERLAELIRKQRALLVLDGLEPLQGGPGPEEGKIKDPALEALVRELGAQNKGMCLITTRIRVKDLDDLAGEKNRQLDLTRLSTEAGAQVLRAKKVKGTEEELKQAVREYDGHSLALTLLGSYLEEACEGEIRKRDTIGPLEEDDRHGKHARRVMSAYERWFKSGPEIAVLRMLGLFDRPANKREVDALRASPAIPGLTEALEGLDRRTWNKTLARLRRVGLLAAAPGDKEENSTLDVHPLVREHFGAALRRAQPEAWREGHRRLYEHLRGKAKERPETVEEMGPLYAAVVHGCRAGMHRDALSLYMQRVQRGNDWFNARQLGSFGSDLVVLAAFFDQPWEDVSPELDTQEQSLVLTTAGFALRTLGRLREAAQLASKGLDINFGCGDWVNASAQASNLSVICVAQGDLNEALTHEQFAFSLAYKSGHIPRFLESMTASAGIMCQLGRSDKALAQFEKAEEILKKTNPACRLLLPSWGAFSYYELLLDREMDAKVLAVATAALAWAEELHLLLDIALAHLSLGRAHLLAAKHSANEHLPPAATHVKCAIDGLRQAGYQEYLPSALLARAELRLLTGDPPRAHADLDEALGIATRSGMRLHQTDAHLGYARLHLALPTPAPTQARAHLTEARALITATGYHRRDAELARLEALLPPRPPSAG